MQENVLARRRLGEIKAAIARAKTYAEEHHVPLTVERLAAELDMEVEIFRRAAKGELCDGGRSMKMKAAVLRRACGEATASVMEHAMQRGSSPNMHMLYLKNNAGYSLEKNGKGIRETEESIPFAPVVFMGEENIAD